MTRSNFNLKTLTLLVSVLFLFTFGGVWSVRAQEDVLPLPDGTPADTSGVQISFDNPLARNEARLGLGMGSHAGRPAAQTEALPGLNTASRLFSETQQITPPAGVANDTFGYDIWRDGDQMAVGIPGRLTYTGGVYIYQRSGAGTWGSPVLVTASDLAADDTFGYSVALLGDTLFVSAAGQTNSKGALYIFKRDSGGTWVQTQKFSPVVPDNSVFGADIRIDPSGERIIVAGGMEGTAYIYHLVSTAWQFETKITVGNVVARADINGDTALLGSYGSGVSGTVHVYRLNSGSWIPDGSFMPTDSHIDDNFGGRVITDGSFAFVLGDNDTAGAVYVFEEIGSSWVQRQKLIPLDGSTGDNFGLSFDVEGNTLVIGSPLNELQQGSAYIFNWNGTAWTQQAKIPAVGNLFGYAVELVNEDLIASAPAFNSQVGKVYVYTDPDLIPAVELLTDGSFESNAAGWTVKNETGDKVKCNKTGKVFAHTGNCAWRFKGEIGENAKIQQEIISGADAGDTLTLSGYVNASGTVDGKVKVVVKYLDTTIPKNKITVNILSETSGGYIPLSSFQPLLTTDVTAPFEKIKVQVKNSGESGKVYYDDLSLIAQ
jgi:hypothetical protein